MEVKTGQFEGSLDLLLFLVKKHKMNPLDLKISEITDEFVSYVKEMDKVDIESASDFILMASTLMEIKSRMLLNPSKEVVEKQSEIAKQLYEYSLVKNAMEKIERLYNLHSMEYDISIIPEFVKEVPETLPDEFIKIINSVKNEINLRKRVYRITRDLYSFSKKMEAIKALISKRRKMKLGEIIEMSKDRLEAVVTFVTILELLRLKFIIIDSESSVMINEEYDG
ncbi:segregation and condensation protein A [Athalassotoga saccharophila]|uniref:segregation and condensation protein A n=1 Tax=Athalassotoga saccharophila TaxID=1441386 RepID=UPI00137B458C|nr:segregation/condensation protein A [Athalassotoga saccharophila]BBJ27316.1 segregation and condensation protein A [Athalassotoga saccharophila]